MIAGLGSSSADPITRVEQTSWAFTPEPQTEYKVYWNITERKYSFRLLNV